MNRDPIRRFLERLEKVQPSTDGWTARCPAHDDTNPSLSVREGTDGKVLVKCHAGCDIEAVVQALGLEMTDLFPGEDGDRPPYTLEHYAREKRLPADWLVAEFGLRTHRDHEVVLPYLDEEGNHQCAKYRGADHFRFAKGAKPILYGLHRLPERGSRLLLVEGESDIHACTFHDMPALGVPGASSWRSEWAAHLEGFDLYIWREPDQGGTKLVRSLAADLPDARVIQAPDDAADPADLHLADPDAFMDRLNELIQAARPIAELVDELPGPSEGDKAEQQPVPIQERLGAAGFDTLGDDPEAEDVGVVVRRLPTIMSDADPVDRALLREAAIQRLKDAGVVGARGMVEAALKEAQDDEEAELQGRRIAFEDPEPWSDSVDGAELLTALRDTLLRYMVLPDGGSAAVALWILHAHAHEAAVISPILSFTSAVRGCGKTTALTLAHALTPRALFASNLTPASLFRAVEKHVPTLLVDEADTFLDRRDDLRGLLNSGHFRAGAIVVRSVGDDHEPRAFSTWAPKALAKIGELPATLADRSIVVRMRRVTPAEYRKLERVRLDRIHGQLNPLLRKAARWAQDHVETLTQADPAIPDDLRDRQADNARPLLAIADQCGGAWPERARKALRRLYDRDVDREEAGILLLADLRDLFQVRGAERLPSKEIVQWLGDQEDRPWPEWKHGERITPRQLAKLLRPFEVKPKALWIGKQTLRGYEFDDLRDPLERYVGGVNSKGPQGPSNTGETPESGIRKAGESLSDRQSTESPTEAGNLGDLTDAEGGSQGKSGKHPHPDTDDGPELVP